MTGTSLLFFLAAISGLVAAGYWLRVAMTLEAGGEGAALQNRRAFGFAAMSTSIALALASAGVLIPALLG